MTATQIELDNQTLIKNRKAGEIRFEVLKYEDVFPVTPVIVDAENDEEIPVKKIDKRRKY